MNDDLFPGGWADQVFPGRSEMAALMRSTDWSRTRFGPVESWPKSLRTVVGVLLGSRFPMMVWWGPTLLNLYNDAYRPILREKHPALAIPAAELWAEIWDFAGPLARGILAGGPSTWMEDVQLFIKSGDMAEETYFTFSYSPVPDDEGRVGGLLNTVQETTLKVRSERQIRMLHDLAARASEAQSEEEACRISMEVLSTNELDLPFALLYRLDESGAEARLVGTSGLGGYDGPARAPVVRAGGPGRSWPLFEAGAAQRAVLVQDLESRMGPLPAGRWHARPERALVLPLSRSGRSTSVLVAGLSPHRRYDERYERFFRATADQVASILAGARAYEAEKKRAEALAEIDRAKTAFFSNVSHEFRTPLTLMLGPLEDELAEKESPLPRPRHERLLAVHRNSLRLLKLVNSLLEFSRIEAGRAQASYEPTDLAKYTAELASSFRSAMDRAGLDFTIDCPALPYPVYVDHDMWEKIVLNLISNAFKHTFKGRIAVRVRDAGEYAELEIADTGVGIAPADQNRLFERFHRVKGTRSRTHEGSGIGLALVKELAALHAGTVSVESQPGQGSRFTVRVKTGMAHLPADRIVPARAHEDAWAGTTAYLEEALRWLPEPQEPRLAQGPRAATSATLTLSPPGETAGGSRPRILLADDNADMRDYIRRLLGGRYDILAVPDGAAALRVAREEPKPELVLSDVMMPELDGFGLLAALRKDPLTKGIPIILLSARAGEESAVEGLAAGADDYVVKPFSARELLARVKTHLDIARFRRESALELAKANQELDAFCSSVSHDLRAPLRAIGGYSKMVLEDFADKLGAEGRRQLEVVVSGTRKMAKLIDNLLEFSRLGRKAPVRFPFEPDVLAREVLDELLAHCPERTIDATVDPLPKAWGDPALLRQVFANLLSNAVKYTRTRDRARIEVGGSSGAMDATFWVKDNGVGFDSELSHKLFKVFQRLHSEEEFEGTGVGLALVHRIVERHGGRVWAEGTPGGGAAFVFTLPLRETDSDTGG